MNFLDVPSSSSASSSFMLDETKLGAGRPEAPEPPISFPGQQSSSKLQSQTITPLASFLLKSYLDKEANIFIPSQGTSTTFPPKLKVFINVTHHHLVPAPPPPSSASAKGVALDVWVPGVVGDISVTVDKVGSPSLLIDVILSTEVHTKLKKDAEFKLYIIQVALEKVEEKLSIDLSRNYSLPKTLASKGPLLPRTVILPSLPTNSTTAPPPKPTPTVFTSSNPPPSSSDAPFLSVSSTTRSLLPRPKTSFVLDEEKKSFTFTILVPLVVPLPRKGEEAKGPKTTLEFVEPGTVRFGVERVYSLEEDLTGRLGKGKVDEKGWEAEWRVGEGKVVVKGRVVV